MKLGNSQETQKLWDYFIQLSQIPRPSQAEGKVIEFLEQYARERQLETRKDSYGNLSILVPGKNCAATSKRVILQGHVDMVTDARPGVQIDFHKDSIQLKVEGDKLMAQDTTLGADNGIGVVASLAVVDQLATHPPLNLLFTVDEERGLHGASELDPTLLEGEVLLNLDGEDFGYFFIGCAGGADVRLETELACEEREVELFEFSVSNLKGGHSGVDIHLNRQSANKILIECLGQEFREQIQISSIQSGKAHNIIARDGAITFALNGDEAEFINFLNKRIDFIQASLIKDDQAAEFELKKLPPSKVKLLSSSATQKLMSFVTLHLHGAINIDWSFANPVTQSSINLAKIILKDGQLFVLSSFRFNDPVSGQKLKEKVEAFYRQFEWAPQISSGYPAWAPNWESPVLAICQQSFQEIFPDYAECTVTAMHAGLECGILLSKKPTLDAISFGPDIRNAHSPDEYVSIASVEKFWTYLIGLLQRLSQ